MIYVLRSCPSYKAKIKARKNRFLTDPISIRLGNLASNLARLNSFARQPAMRDAADRIIYESKHFIEWCVADTVIAVQVELLELQRELARWQLEWMEIWTNVERREQIAVAADRWSKKILEHSGLLNSNTDPISSIGG